MTSKVKLPEYLPDFPKEYTIPNEDRKIYERYREILGKPNLSDREIDEMRVYVSLLAEVIAEYVLDREIH